MKCNGVLGVNQSKKDAEIVLRSSIFTYCQHCFFGNWCSSLDLDLNVVNTETRNDNGTLHFFDDCDNDCSIFRCDKCDVKNMLLLLWRMYSLHSLWNERITIIPTMYECKSR